MPFEDNKTLEDVACYLVRAPLSLKKLVCLDGQKAVLYRSKMNPFLGRGEGARRRRPRSGARAKLGGAGG